MNQTIQTLNITFGSRIIITGNGVTQERDSLLKQGRYEAKQLLRRKYRKLIKLEGERYNK